MKNQKILSEKQARFIDYLLSFSKAQKTKLPPISQIGEDLGMSTPNTREQIELARNLGLIQILPRRGISILPYDFTPAVSKSLYYAINQNPNYFDQFSELRNKLEKAFFVDAVSSLGDSEIQYLFGIVRRARGKLGGDPIQIPHHEHRQYHLSIYSNLNNAFLDGLFRSYWDMYELVGLDMFTDLTYLNRVWDYHEEILQQITCKDYLKAYELLEEHIDLIYTREGSKKVVF